LVAGAMLSAASIWLRVILSERPLFGDLSCGTQSFFWGVILSGAAGFAAESKDPYNHNNPSRI